MFYSFDITIAKSTTQAAPHTEDLKLGAGIIHYVEIEFPSGCQGLAHIQLLYEGAHYLPTNPDSDFASDNYVIPIREYKELTAGASILKAVAWNDDDTYSHTIIVRIGVLPVEVMEPQTGLIAGIKKFLGMVGIK